MLGGSQALREVRHRHVDVFFWQLFPDGLQDDFNSCFGFSLWYGMAPSMAPQS